jgi:hypothetical protein
MMMNKQLLYMTAMIGCAASIASGQTLASWENDHLSGNAVMTTAGEAPSAGGWDAGLAYAPVLSRGSGGTATTFNNTFAMRMADSVDLAAAIANARYLTFTLEAAAGNLLNLSGLDAIITAQNATNHAISIAVMTELTGFGAGDAVATWQVGGTGDSSGWLGVSRTLDLSAVSALQGVVSTEFRLYIYGHTGEWDQVGLGRSFQENGTTDLAVSGSISAVPEPSLFGALAGGLALVWVLRRRASKGA